MSIATTVAGLPLKSCIYNASGPRTGSHQALANIGKSDSGAVLAKSATVLAQEGNPTPRYKEIDVGGGEMMSINSEGLPNKGIDYYLQDGAIAAGKDNDKPYFISLSAKNLVSAIYSLIFNNNLVYNSGTNCSFFLVSCNIVIFLYHHFLALLSSSIVIFLYRHLISPSSNSSYLDNHLNQHGFHSTHGSPSTERQS